MAGIYHLAENFLRNSEWAVLPSDKDSCFVLVNREELHGEMLRVLGGREYIERPLNSLSHEDLWIGYCEICQHVAFVMENDQELLRALIRNGRGDIRRCISTLRATVKTHKGPGDVKLRAIHASSGTPFRPAMRWLASIAANVLRDQPHLIKNSEEAVHFINTLHVPPSAVMLKIDVEDFFMSGEHGELCRVCSEHIPADIQSPFSPCWISYCGVSASRWRVSRTGAGLYVVALAWAFYALGKFPISPCMV